MLRSNKRKFVAKIFEEVSKIPRGETRTYGEIARVAGNKKAARAVGKILSFNYDIAIPCHRVISKNGLGGFNRGIETKLKLLKKEGGLKNLHP